jgi:hypothetical protein
MREDFETTPRKPRKIGIAFALVFIVIIAIIGLYVLGASSKKAAPVIAPTPTSVPTLIPVVTEEEVSPTVAVSPTKEPKTTLTPTPSKKVSSERSGLEITVLNGSGVAGAAKSISSYLSDLGYTVKTTANAKSFDYQGLTVNVSKAKSSYLAQLKKDLTGKSASMSAQVDDSLTVDAEVIIGK